MGTLMIVLVAMVCLLVGVGLGYGITALLSRRSLANARAEGEAILARSKTDAQTEADKLRVEAERKALERREKLDAELETARSDMREQERRLAKREDLSHRKEEMLAEKDDRLTGTERAQAARDVALDRREEEIAGQEREVGRKLMAVSGMSAQQATEALIERVRDESRHEIAKVVRDIADKAEEEAEDKAREVLVQAVQRFASDVASESTVRTVQIPSDDMKGRIIGREGRNIRAIEKVTGVDIIVDDTPGVIVVSCFDRIRQAVAVRSLEKLIADGRMHPSRIEEIVEKTRAEIDEQVIKSGKDATLEVNVKGLHPKISEAMGKLSFRTSYGQNVLKHSLEVAYFSQIIAEQLGLNGTLARRCGYLHDIGKAMDHEMEGGHPAIGMAFAKQYGEKDEAVLNAIGGHHADIPSTTFYTPIVMAADALSSARPGARRESMDKYIQRLTELQDIALGFRGVTEAFAVQAGREVRVMVDAQRVDDDEAYLIAHEIAKRVADEMTFPGEIKVTVLRETRAIELAR